MAGSYSIYIYIDDKIAPALRVVCKARKFFYTATLKTFWLFFTTYSKVSMYRIYAYSPLILGVEGVHIFQSNVFFVDAFYFI